MAVHIPKSIGAANHPKGGEVVDVPRALTSHPPAIAEHYAKYEGLKNGPDQWHPHISRAQTTARTSSGFGDEDDLGESDMDTGVQAKAIYHTPHGQVMVKPFTEQMWGQTKPGHESKGFTPTTGWSEMTNQALYHAAGIGDLHQTVHGQMHGKTPVLVHHMTPGLKRASSMRGTNWLDISPEAKAAHIRIHAMDFLTDNNDRHSANLLIHPETHKPLAIDHGGSFAYGLGETSIAKTPAMGMFAATDITPDIHTFMMDDNGEGESFAETYKDQLRTWWPGVRNQVKAKMDEHLTHLKDPAHREHVRRGFESRMNHLDSLSRHATVHGELPENWHHQSVTNDRSFYGIEPPAAGNVDPTLREGRGKKK